MNTNANQYPTQGVKTEPKRVRRPKRATIDRQRRDKLLAVLRDVRAAIASRRCDAEQIEAVAPLITTAVVEIAALNGVTDATGSAVVEYGALIAEALGWLDDPHPAFDLWSGTAPGLLADAADRRSQHIERAERDGESQLFLERITDLTLISVALNLTRPRIKEIFGETTCALPPVKIRDHRFTPEERKELRVLTSRLGRFGKPYTRDHLGDLAATNPEAFCDIILWLELSVRHDADTIDRNRIGLKGETDIDVSRSISDPKPWDRSRKPGPKPKADTLQRQIEAVAALLRRSTRTIERRMNDLKSAVEAGTIEMPEVDGKRYGIKGVAITDPWLIQVAYDPCYEGRRKTYAHLYADLKLIIRWHKATRGFEPKRKTLQKWAERGILAGYAATAKAWERENDLYAADVADADKSARVFDHTKKETVSDARSATGAVQPVEYVLSGPDLQPPDAPWPEGGDADVRS